MTKATGIVRGIDNLGRITIPMELRRTLGIKTTDSIEIFVNGDGIMLRKYEPACTFCGKFKAHPFKGKLVCDVCRGEMNGASVVI